MNIGSNFNGIPFKSRNYKEKLINANINIRSNDQIENKFNLNNKCSQNKTTINQNLKLKNMKDVINIYTSYNVNDNKLINNHQYEEKKNEKIYLTKMNNLTTNMNFKSLNTMTNSNNNFNHNNYDFKTFCNVNLNNKPSNEKTPIYLIENKDNLKKLNILDKNQ